MRVLMALLRALAPRPALWPEALRAATALAPDGWWRRPPFLPLPDRAYLAWRLETAYGVAALPDEPGRFAADLVTYLRWRRRLRAHVRARLSEVPS